MSDREVLKFLGMVALAGAAIGGFIGGVIDASRST